MHDEHQDAWEHSHSFGQDGKRPGEMRTFAVVLLTLSMMVVEIAAGVVFGSMALLADGLHMASHAAALTINAMAYVYCRRHAHDVRFSFGSGKVNALGGFTGAILLVVFAVAMAWQSIDRFIHPIDIAVDQAIVVAILGLLVNGISALILDHGHEALSHHPYDRDGAEAHGSHHHHSHAHAHDHNLRSAYLHVLADALTSVLAITALLAAKYFGQVWMDPFMGILGALLVCNWSRGLLRSSSAVLLDHQGPAEIRQRIRSSLEKEEGNRVVDLHLWSIAPHLYGLIVAVVSHHPKPPAHYKRLLPANLSLAHVTVEVHPHPESSHQIRPDAMLPRHLMQSGALHGITDKKNMSEGKNDSGGNYSEAI